MTAPHVLGPFIGFGEDFHADCSCGCRHTGTSHDALRDAHGQHLARLASGPGVERARRMLAESVARGKPATVGERS